VTTPPSRPPRSGNGEREVLGVVPLLRAEGGEEESQFGLVAPEDVRPSEAETINGERGAIRCLLFVAFALPVL